MAKNINNLDKSLKQNITPADIGAATSSSVTTVSNNIGTLSNLQTSEKGSLVGAINELFQSANSGKQLIANAIGEPLNASDTFSAMSSDINSLLSTFKTNMMNNGISVESGDKFKSLIDKIATLTDNEGKGVQIANGITKTALATKSFSNAVGSLTTSFSYIEIRNLTFVPQIILAFAQNGYGGYNTFTMYNTFSMYPERVYIVLSQPGGTAGGSVKVAIHANSCNIDSTGFTIPVYTYGTTSEDCYWVAVGVGEEDTTLRDSLADILENKGVDVTEEDDMASLISKVENVKPSLNVKAGDSIELYSKVAGQSSYGFAVGANTNRETHYLNVYGSVKFFIRMSVNSTAMYVKVKLVDQTKTNVKFEKKLTNSATSSFYGHTVTIENIENTDYLIFEYYSSNVINGIVVTSFKITADLV